MKRNGLEEYLRQVSKILDCSRTEKKIVVEQVRSMLSDVPGIETMTLEKVCAEAGSPEELAREFLNPERMQKSRFVRRTVGAVLVTGILLLAIWGGTRTSAILPISNVHYEDASTEGESMLYVIPNDVITMY